MGRNILCLIAATSLLSTTSESCQGVTRAAPASRLFHQNTMLHQIVNVPQGRILRAFGHFGPFGGSQLAFKLVKQPVEDRPLSVIK